MSEAAGAGSERAERRARAMSSRLFWPAAALVLIADLVTKAWAFGFLEAEGRLEQGRLVHWVADPWFRLAQEENTGTLWGIGQGHNAVLRLLRTAMVAFLLWLAWKSRRGERAKSLGLGLVLGGAVGNLYDNWTRASGAVRDFLDFFIPLPWREDLYHYPTFNVADSAILFGLVCLVFGFWREDRCAAKQRRALRTPPAEAGEPGD